MGSLAWPVGLPDIPILDFILWSHLKSRYTLIPTKTEELKQILIETVNIVPAQNNKPTFTQLGKPRGRDEALRLGSIGLNHVEA